MLKYLTIAFVYFTMKLHNNWNLLNFCNMLENTTANTLDVKRDKK